MSDVAYLYAEAPEEAPAALAARLEETAAKQWDIFYSRNADKFYKDRHYFEKEWPALCSGPATLLEVGCGVGNTVYPLLELNPALSVHACDFSSVAVGVLKQHPLYTTGKVHGFVADLTSTDLCAHVSPGTVDYVTMVFVLSAVAPPKMPGAVANVARCLKPGGQLLFRDYEAGDLVQELRQSASAPRKLGERFFARGDGTRCFHFESAELVGLMASVGLTCRELKVHEREVENRRRGIVMRRRWLQAVFEKTSPSPEFPPPPGSLPAFPPTSPGQFSTPTPSPSTGPVLRNHTGITSSSVGGGGGVLAGLDSGPPIGVLSGTWLTGAAGRLASHAAVLPGVASGRAQLPETLDSADELVSQLSPAARSAHRSTLSATSSSPGVGPRVAPQGQAAARGRRGTHDHSPGVQGLDGSCLEADLEREFFETVGRSTEEVVAEELAAAGLAGIRLEDPFTSSPLPTQPVGNLSASYRTPALSNQPPPIPAGGCQDQEDEDMHDMDSLSGPIAAWSHPPQQPVAVQVAVGCQLQCPYPEAAAMAVAAGAQLEQRTVQLELLLARLLLGCTRAPASSALAGLVQGSSVLQLDTTPGAWAGMTAVRFGGARRALLTCPHRDTLQAVAQCVHANRACMVVERLRVAQLSWTQQATVKNVLSRLAAVGGADLIICGSLEASCQSGPEALSNVFKVARMAAQGQPLPTESAVRSTRQLDSEAVVAGDVTQTGQGQHGLGSCGQAGVKRTPCMLFLVAGEQAQVVHNASQAHGWQVHEGSHQLTEVWQSVGGSLPVGGLVQPLLLKLADGNSECSPAEAMDTT